MLVEFVPALNWAFHFRESVYVLIVTRHTFNVCACTSDSQGFDNAVAYFLCQFLKVTYVSIWIITQFSEFYNQRSKESCQIADTINGAMTWVLKQQYLVVKVCWGVVHRRCRYEHHLFLVTWYIASFHTGHLANLLQLLKG